MVLQILQIKFFWIVAVLLKGLKCLPKRDCQDYKDGGFNESGVYHVTPLGTWTGFDVYCDLITDGGGWLVFQRRCDGSVNFYRNWDEYEHGFGNTTGEHWLGNLALNAITYQGLYEMRVDLADWEGNIGYAKYRTFRIEHTKYAYRLTIGGYSGDAGKKHDLNYSGACSCREIGNCANCREANRTVIFQALS